MAAVEGPLSETLRAATAAWHDRVESLPFARALAEGRADRTGYVVYLRALEAVHEAIDEAVAATREPRLRRIASAGQAGRVERLRRDLDELGSEVEGGAGGAALLQAALMGQAIRRRALEVPISLVGYLYVMEGSALGGVVLARLVGRALGLSEDRGTAYLAGAGRATQAGWERFRRALDGLDLEEGARRGVLEAAVEAFAGLHRVLEVLGPFDARPLRDLVHELNPSAGAHMIIGDARELDAALRAGEHTWEEFPYYAARYGERGRRFTRSDSAWLAALNPLPAEQVVDQVEWLARVLAARGMPRWLLERHLRVLHALLVRAVPERRAGYRSLLAASRRLRAARRAVMGEEAMRALALDFDRAVGPEWSARLPRTGALLAAAVADEAAGVERAVESIETWLTDAARFPPRWIEAVGMTLAAARLARLGSP